MNVERCASILFALSFLLAPSCTPSHEHPPTSADEGAELEPTSITAFGGRVLLFLEFPHLVTGEEARFLAHFSVLANGEPIRAGRVSLTIGETHLVALQTTRDGLFIPVGSLPTAGSFAGRLVLESAQADETFDLGEIVVHGSTALAERFVESTAEAAPADGVPFLLEQQWTSQLLLAQAQPRSLTRKLTLPAQVRVAEGAEVVVSAPAGGRLLPPANGSPARTGDMVRAGQSLGWVEPPLGAADLAQLKALRIEFELRALDVARAAGEAASQLQFATNERKRVAKLRENGLSTAREFEVAERELSLAKSASEAAGTGLAVLVQYGAERKDSDSQDGIRLPLTAALSGTLIAVARISGESVQVGEELFRIRDTTRLWIEAQIFEFDLPQLGERLSGTVKFDALPSAPLSLATEAGSSPWTLLPTIDTRTRTATLRAEITSPDSSIKSGMLAQVELATATVQAAVVVPREAVVMVQGQAVAFVMLEGELFQRRELELGLIDGDFVEVKRGLSVGERVATRGANDVRLAALAPASMGSGHQH